MSKLTDTPCPFLLATTTIHARACSLDDGTNAALEPEMIDDPFGAETAWELHDVPAYPLH